MELYDAMSTLRAVRRLRADPIPEDVLERVLAAATWAPTGGNAQPWRIVLVREPAQKKGLAALYEPRWASYVRGHAARRASMETTERARLERTLAAGDHLARHLGSVPAVAVFCYRPALMAITDAGLPRPSVVGGASVYPAVQNLMLACRNEGLGCVLTTLLCMDEPKVKELLGIPEGWYTCAHVPMGYPVGRGHGPLSRRPVEKMVWADRWGTAYRT
jgi:nitroreductase